MSYKVFSFEAKKQELLCMEYCAAYMQVLSAYGSRRFEAAPEAWMNEHGVHVIAMRNHAGEMIAALRLHCAPDGASLPLRSRICDAETLLESFAAGNGSMIAEISGIWVAKASKNQGLEKLLCEAAIVLAQSIGCEGVISQTDPKDRAMFAAIGFEPGAQRCGHPEFSQPFAAYSAVMLLPELQSAPRFNRVQQVLRTNPDATFISQNPLMQMIQYNLERMRTAAEAAVPELA